jgi:putative toxin-antitoxin system antitoxin component (TIGR02293 family)
MARAARKSKTSSSATGFAEDAQPFVHDDIVRGIDARDVQNLIDQDVLDAKSVYRVIPERTFLRRLTTRTPLKVSEGDAIARLLRVTKAAHKTFDKDDFARQWLRLPNPALNNRVPIELAETDAGAREVEDVIGRIAYGLYS